MRLHRVNPAPLARRPSWPTLARNTGRDALFALGAGGYNAGMGVRMIAMDIDGTLLDSRWQVSEENRRAIGDAVGRGIEVVLVTGRRFDFARPVAEQLP